LIAIAAFAGPAAGAAGRSQENLVLRPLLRRSPPGLVLDKGPRGGPGGAGRHLRATPLLHVICDILRAICDIAYCESRRRWALGAPVPGAMREVRTRVSMVC
jgi:hypothetical protein